MGLLIQLGAVAVLTAREAGRQALCLSNLRQLAMGTQAHLASRGHFPAGGWSWEWVGDPKRGAERAQPGGWIFNVLPYLDHSHVHDHALVAQPDMTYRERISEMEIMTLPVLYCPSRRSPHAYPRDWAQNTLNSVPTLEHAKTDYAANGGDLYVNLGPGPRTYAEADDADFRWLSGNNIGHATGVIFPRSYTTPITITDGLSKTYLIGEKYLNPQNYHNGRDDGDDFTIYQGDDMDISRWTTTLLSDPSKGLYSHPNLPRRDLSEFSSAYAFGSAHGSGWNATFCDGSARRMSYDLDAAIHQQMGNIRDQEAAGYGQ